MTSISRKKYLYAGLAVFFWSTVATAFKIGLRELDFMQLIFFASVVSTFVLGSVLLFQGKIGLLTKQSGINILNSMALGILNPVMYYLVLFKAYSLLPAQIAQPLNMVWPFALALLSVPLLGHKIKWTSWLALTISFSGVVFISSRGSLSGFENTSLTGVSLALGSSVVWALYWILNVRDKRDPVLKLFMGFCFGTLFLLPVVAIFSDFSVQSGQSILAAIYIGIFEVGLTYIFWLKAMELSTNNARLGNLIYFAPFLSLVFIRFILEEPIYVTTPIGLALIVVGVLLQQIKR